MVHFLERKRIENQNLKLKKKYSCCTQTYKDKHCMHDIDNVYFKIIMWPSHMNLANKKYANRGKFKWNVKNIIYGTILIIKLKWTNLISISKGTKKFILFLGAKTRSGNMKHFRVQSKNLGKTKIY